MPTCLKKKCNNKTDHSKNCTFLALMCWPGNLLIYLLCEPLWGEWPVFQHFQCRISQIANNWYLSQTSQPYIHFKTLMKSSPAEDSEIGLRQMPSLFSSPCCLLAGILSLLRFDWLTELRLQDRNQKASINVFPCKQILHIFIKTSKSVYFIAIKQNQLYT